jgi:hypothetical protein
MNNHIENPNTHNRKRSKSGTVPSVVLVDGEK